MTHTFFLTTNIGNGDSQGLPRNRNANEIAAADQIAPTLTGIELANAGARWDETNSTENQQLPRDDDSMEVSHGNQY